METRSPAVAGMFYPGPSKALAEMADHLINQITVPHDDQLAVAYVVPHAGWRYSGPVAAQVYARLARHAATVRRIVLIGPAHHVPLEGCAVTRTQQWRTPLGDVPVDHQGASAIVAALGSRTVVMDDFPHAPEHSLEVQVPFLQRVLDPGFTILPICVGHATPDLVASVIGAAGGGRPGTVVLCSTDFSHYLPDAEARERDRRTARAVVELSVDGIGSHDACGRYALCGLLRWGSSQPVVMPELLALGTSADTCGDPARVVGYPAFAFHRPISS